MKDSLHSMEPAIQRLSARLLFDNSLFVLQLRTLRLPFSDCSLVSGCLRNERDELEVRIDAGN